MWHATLTLGRFGLVVCRKLLSGTWVTDHVAKNSYDAIWWARAAPVRRPRCCSPARVPRSAGRSCHLSERHRLHACVHPLGVAALARWGLLTTRGNGLSAVQTYSDPTSARSRSLGRPSRSTAISRVRTAPRRTVLDKLLLDAAAEAGAEVREGFTVEELVFDNGAVTGVRRHGRNGGTTTESARVVIGADGRNSMVAKRVQASSLRRAVGSCCLVLHVLGRAANRRRRDLHPSWPRLGRGRNTRRPDARRRRLADRRVRDEPEGCRGRLPTNARVGAGILPSGSTRRPGRRDSPARPCRTSSGNRMARGGRSLAMRVTPRIRSQRTASWTPSSAPSG